MKRIINAVAPIRICDLGGWSDTWFARRGCVLNMGVYPYVQCQMSVDEARGHEVHAEWVFSSLLGKDKITGGYCDSKGVLHARDAFVNNDNMKKAIKSASFSVYRVNAYDFNNCQYTINSSANGGNASSDFTLDNPLLYYNKK